MPIIFIFGLLYYFIWISGASIENIFDNSLTVSLLSQTDFYIFVCMGSFLLGIAIHELIHGIFFAKYAKNGFKSIKFGILWKVLAPYCHCKEPLTVQQYLTAVIMPTIILGIFPAIISLFIGDALLLIFGIIFTFGGAGDMLIFYSLRKANKTDLVMDHPSEIGCYLFRKINENFEN